MRGTERRLAIINEIQKNGSGDINQLAVTFNVSTMTIRRDLAKLEQDGLIRIEYGGAILNDGAMFEYDMSMKLLDHKQEKERIARSCLDIIRDGDSIYLDSGTTVLEISKLLSRKKNIKIMTHSLLVANALASTDVNLIMAPGQFRNTSMAYMGQLTDSFIRSFKFDKYFLSAEGIEWNKGVSVPDIVDGVTKKTIIEQSDFVVGVMDSSKFNKSFRYKICDISKIDMVITDQGLSDDEEKRIAQDVLIIKV